MRRDFDKTLARAPSGAEPTQRVLSASESSLLPATMAKYRGYKAAVAYSEDDKVFHGRIAGITGIITFDRHRSGRRSPAKRRRAQKVNRRVSLRIPTT